MELKRLPDAAQGHRVVLRVLFLASLSSSTACTLGPDYVKPDIDMPQRWHTQGESAKEEAIDPHWWRWFGDAELDRARNRIITAALFNS